MFQNKIKIVILGLVLLITTILGFSSYILSKIIDNKASILSTSSKIERIKVTLYPRPTFINSPTVQVKPTIIPTKVYNAETLPSNALVNCNINANCGGGTKTLKKSDCINSTCCWRAEGSGRWEFYTSKEQCKADQAKDIKVIEGIQNDIKNLISGSNTSNQPVDLKTNNATNLNNYVTPPNFAPDYSDSLKPVTHEPIPTPGCVSKINELTGRWEWCE